MKIITEKDGAGVESKHPFFIIKQKLGDQWVEKERFKAFTATPYAIELGSYKWKDQDIDTVKMQFIKDGENIQLEFSLDNGLSRNLLNTMLGVDKIGELSMSLYVNKESYASIGIENDGQRGEWKYKHTEFPTVEKNKKGVVIDNEEYLRFMRQMVEDIKKKLPMSAPELPEKSNKMPANKNADKGDSFLEEINKPVEETESDTDTLPF